MLTRQLVLLTHRNLAPQIIFRKVADLKHEQELDEMQQNQPQQEFSQDHIVRRLISKFRKPSDAVTIGLPPPGGSSNLLQVPQPTHGPLPTVSGQLAAGSSDSGHQSGDSASAGQQATSGGSASSTASGRAGLLASKQSRWSQLVASAAAGAASKSPAAGAQTGQALSSTRSLLDITPDPHGGESSSNRSSADGRDDEMDENYFRPGGKGHQALLDNMDKR